MCVTNPPELISATHREPLEFIYFHVEAFIIIICNNGVSQMRLQGRRIEELLKKYAIKQDQVSRDKKTKPITDKCGMNGYANEVIELLYSLFILGCQNERFLTNQKEE